jgi:pimeloyl-ACP methyl ester carboxylesterase
VNLSIETRELFVLDGSDVPICGTYHKVDGDHCANRGDVAAKERLGIVFLNSTSPTRAANGDAAIYLADSFARCGYPSFRIDLPGFGDSLGEYPDELLGFICRGGYAPIASAKIKELVTRYGLSGVVIAGHCAGSVSALFTAARTKECRGLILIGPFFHLTKPIAIPKLGKKPTLPDHQGRLQKYFSKVYELLKQTARVQGRELPPNANVALLRYWKKLASDGLPILFLKGPERKSSGAKSKSGEFDYLTYLLRVAGRRNQISLQVTEGASNAFSNHQGRSAVRQHAERWLKTHFPLIHHHEMAVSTSALEISTLATLQPSRVLIDRLTLRWKARRNNYERSI